MPKWLNAYNSFETRSGAQGLAFRDPFKIKTLLRVSWDAIKQRL